jgi:altronate dehydratase
MQSKYGCDEEDNSHTNTIRLMINVNERPNTGISARMFRLRGEGKK